MKKFMYSVLAAATMLFATTSCSQEEEILGGEANGNNTQQVTFTVQMPGEETNSRAIAEGVEVGKGNMANKLIWALYEKGETERLDYGLVNPETTKEEGKSVFKAKIDMVKGLEYNVLFFAYNDEKCAFQLATTPEETDLTALELKNSLYANQEGYDAFVKCHEHKVNNELVTTVNLTRPFAQINAATTTTDLNKAKKLNAEVIKSELIIEQVPTQYNIMTGEAKELGNLHYKAKSILKQHNKPSEKVHPNETIIVENVTYEYLNMVYVLAGENKNSEASNHTATFKFYREGETEAVRTIEIPNLPIQRNYRTNVIGNLLTQTEDFKVVIDENFNEPAHIVPVDKYEVSSIEELQTVINDKAQDGVPTTITLTELSRSASLSIEGSITIPSTKVIILDMNGFTLTGTDKGTDNFGLIDMRPGSNLSIINSAETEGKITLRAENNRGWGVYSSVISNQLATLTVGENVTIEHLGGTDMAYGIDNLTNGKNTKAVTTINGATIKSTYRAIRQFLNGTEAFNELYVKSGTIESTNGNKSIWMQDPSTKSNSGKLVIESEADLKGDVYLDVTAGSTEWPVEVSIAASVIDTDSNLITENLPEGYAVVEKEGVYSVVRNYSVTGDIYSIYTAEGLKWVANEVNKVEQYANNIFDGKTVKLVNDINLQGADWIPIGDFGNTSNQFTGTFDGNGKTISNFRIKYNENKVDSKQRTSFGFFGNVNGTIKNLTLSEVINDINTPKFVGVLIGRLNGGLVESCHVKNSSIEINNWTIGGLVGQFNDGKISGCTVENTTVKGYGAVGAITGIALSNGERIIENCSVKGCTLVQNGSFGGEYDKMFGAVVGALYSKQLSVNINDCAVEETTIKGISSNVLCGHVSEGSKLFIDGYEQIVAGLGYNATNKEYVISSAEGLIALSNITIKGGESVKLVANIDLTDVTFNGLSAFNSENNNTFDGQNFTVSNWTYEEGNSDMGFIKSWVGPIKNVKFDNCHLKTNGRSAVVAAKVYGNIENVSVNECSIEDSYWACGIIAGLYNNGNISGCTVTNSSVKSNGGTGGIVGVINETAGERKVTNCSVSNSTIHNTGVYGTGYSGGGLVGMFNAGNASYKIEECTVENNKLEGQHIFETYPNIASASLDEPIK